MSSIRPSSRERLVLQGTRRRQVISARRLALRRIMVRVAKLGLPMLAMMLLAAVALWPEISRMADRGRLALRQGLGVEAESGRMTHARYRGVDERGRPYTLTASWATQASQSRVDLGDPIGDMVLQGGSWMQVKAKRGVFLQHSELLDLSGDVVLYRDDGTIMRTQTATLDVKQGVATSDDQVHVEGPFGVLDAQGFTLTDKGGTIQFQGPARLIMNGGQK